MHCRASGRTGPRDLSRCIYLARSLSLGRRRRNDDDAEEAKRDNRFPRSDFLSSSSRAIDPSSPNRKETARDHSILRHSKSDRYTRSTKENVTSPSSKFVSRLARPSILFVLRAILSRHCSRTSLWSRFTSCFITRVNQEPLKVAQCVVRQV